jgi:hypothetical protein
MKTLIPIAALSLLCGCASQILSPPARFMPFEGPSHAPPDTTWLHFEGGAGGQMFGPSAGGGTLRVAHGVDDVEWSGEASVAYLGDDFPSTASRLWGALRGGARGLLDRDFEHAFWGTGFGAGAYAGGLYLSPEATIGIGYKNEILIPYLSGSVFASLPLTAKRVDTTTDPEAPTSDRPLATFGVRVQLGLEVPIADRASVSMGLQLVRLDDIEGRDEGWVGIGGGAKLKL